ncbi:hypothetical protein QE152_g10255 [Popillia japonica]|uniref:Secreted protein n=1 Tax=Popillia japonica TaxID=7064 RepID=A0AAW1LVP0_POPJA
MSNTVSIVVIFVLAAVVYVHSRSVSDNFKLWRKQQAATKRFNCEPRPRSFLASTMFEELKNDNDTTPSEAILHRCDSQSGCCHGKGVCTMLKTTPNAVAKNKEHRQLKNK